MHVVTQMYAFGVYSLLVLSFNWLNSLKNGNMEKAGVRDLHSNAQIPAFYLLCSIMRFECVKRLI